MRLFRWLLWFPLLGALIALVVVQFWFLVHVWHWVNHNPEITAFMQARRERRREKDPRATIRHQWIPYDRISLHLKRAIVAAEDARFLEHEGFDWEAMQKAYEKNVKKGRVVAGGSTISAKLRREC